MLCIWMVILLGGVGWYNHKQPIVAAYSTKAEYVDVSNASRMVFLGFVS